MSLHKKVLLILLLAAVLPMTAVRLIQDYSIYKLQQSVGKDMRTRLTAQAEQDLLRTVDGYARSLDQEASLVFALLQVQASEVEQRLFGDVPNKPVDVPTVRAFTRILQEDPEALGVELSERHASLNAAGEIEPMPVSYDTQVLLPAPRMRKPGTNARDDLAKLGDMTHIYRKIHRGADDIILWQYTSLESGLHFSYPGKAGIPPGYTPRQRGWYREALEARRAISSRPYVDASTRQLVITFAQPVRASGGKAGGVTAIDLRIRQMLDPALLNTDWSDMARVRVVAAYPALDETKPEGEGVEQIDLNAVLPPAGEEGDAFNLDQDPYRPRTGARQGDQPGRGPDGSISPPDGERDPALGPNQNPHHDLRRENRDPIADTSYPADVYVVADAEAQVQSRRRLDPTRTLALDNDADRQAITQDLLDGVNGVRRVKIKGEDQMVAYGRIGGDERRPIFALISAPTAHIFAPAESTIERVNDELAASLITTGGILIVLMVVVGLVAYWLSFKLTRPITELVTATRRVGGGSLDARVDFDRNDELGELARAFNEMVPALQDRMRIRESLHVAMQVQQSLLPAAAPRVQGLDIAGHSEYCDETGGDYYDFIELDQLGPDTLAVAVGDVTGHGVAAALLMATGRALIRSHANSNASLGEVFTAVNRQLCDSEFTGRFMTLMYLIVEHRCDAQGRVPIRYVCAGHDPVMVYRPAEDRFLELKGGDIPLGIDADWVFNEQRCDELRPGDVLVVGTDGIWECFSPKGEQFGKDRMRETIRRVAGGSSESIAAALSKACRDWRGEREQADDITMVVVKLDC